MSEPPAAGDVVENVDLAHTEPADSGTACGAAAGCEAGCGAGCRRWERETVAVSSVTSPANPDSDPDTADTVLAVKDAAGQVWIKCDTCATAHVFRDRSWFTDYRPTARRIAGYAEGMGSGVVGEGTVTLRLESGELLVLEDALHDPSSCHALISTPRLEDRDHRFMFGGSKNRAMTTPSGTDVPMRDFEGLPAIQVTVVDPAGLDEVMLRKATAGQPRCCEHVHKTLAHASAAVLDRTVQAGAIDGLPKLNYRRDLKRPCIHCARAKNERLHSGSGPTTPVNSPFERVHMDGKTVEPLWICLVNLV